MRFNGFKALYFLYLVRAIPGEKGLIIGAMNPPSIMAFKGIPNKSSSLNNFTVEVMPDASIIWSLASDPKKSVVFASILNAIYTFHNFSFWQRPLVTMPTEYKGRSVVSGQIAFDFVSNNLYWCDSMLNWIAIKPAYNFNNTIYKVIVHKNLFLPEGLALDPEDG